MLRLLQRAWRPIKWQTSYMQAVSNATSQHNSTPQEDNMETELLETKHTHKHKFSPQTFCQKYPKRRRIYSHMLAQIHSKTCTRTIMCLTSSSSSPFAGRAGDIKVPCSLWWIPPSENWGWRDDNESRNHKSNSSAWLDKYMRCCSCCSPRSVNNHSHSFAATYFRFCLIASRTSSQQL